ncbi:uncharacterized protein LOC121377641 [Gigantopelta aegis]|uniref:uncharacterized protein LOC121377641 n=1 Tax=Gigantopelta aegis TaxID=1735272 RepID=UPI001B88E44D|nr:uncharacterized protein LOC121377641 [Gigantopelta aegis]
MRHGNTGYGNQGNSGYGNPGNAGHRNTGYGNQGNSGYGNPGNVGHGNTGYGNQGNSGYGNQGGTGFGGHGTNGYGNQGNSGFGNHGNTGYGNHGNTGYGKVLFCPNQTFYDDNFQLSGVATGYPIQDITTELTNRIDLAACLARTVTLPTAPMLPATDANLGHVKETCPSIKSRLYSFTGTNGRCWFLQNFQEPVDFVMCLTHYCRHCTSKPRTYNNNAVIQNRCIKEYRYVGVYAYCENNAINNRIVYMRIIIPDRCSCKSVYCYPDWH